MPTRQPRLQTALVTGASSGIGRELVRQLVLNRGMTVLATARRADRLASLSDQLPSGQVRTLPGDLTDHAFRARLWDAAETLPGGCHLLVNNAGMGHYASLESESLDTIRQIFELNLLALADMTRHAIPAMKARGFGQIIQISSVLGCLGIPFSSAYVASKHAVNGLTESVAFELHGTGVRIWAALVGRTHSEFSSVASGQTPTTSTGKGSEPVEKVARGILRGLDHKRLFWAPTRSAWAIVVLRKALPTPFHWGMRWYAPRHLQTRRPL